MTAVVKDPVKLTMSVTAEFAADAARVWRLWADPRQLERWWGPPGYPATFVDHEMRPGGMTRYYMTGPDGERFWGWWRMGAIEPPRRLEFEDGFADDKGEPNPDMPVTAIRVTIEPVGKVTRMVLESVFPSTEAMEQVIAMGAEEGMKQALGQIDGLLAEG